MNFKSWYQENIGDGAAFLGAPGADGTGNYGDVGPQTRYNGHGATYGARSHLDQVEKMFGFKNKRWFKRIKKRI